MLLLRVSVGVLKLSRCSRLVVVVVVALAIVVVAIVVASVEDAYCS